MPKKTTKRRQKKLKSHIIVTPHAIVIPLNEEQRKKVKDSIRKTGEAKFKIEEVRVRAIPSSGLEQCWIQI